MQRPSLHVAASLAALALIAGDALGKKPENPGKPDKSSFGKARSLLVRPPDGPDDDAKGRIDIQRRRNGSSFRVMGQRLDPGTAVDIVIERLGDDPLTEEVETAAVLESEVLADNASTNDEGSVKVMILTHKSDALPLGAESLDDLVGTRVSIRVEAAGDDGADILVGTVPGIGADLPKRVRERVALDPVGDTACVGTLRLSFRGKDIRSELRIDVRGLAPGDAVSFRMDDGAGNLAEIGTATADADGEARYRARTNHGDMLPFGAATVLDLQGRAVECWVNPEFVDPTPEIPDDPLEETGLCLTGTVPGGP